MEYFNQLDNLMKSEWHAIIQKNNFFQTLLSGSTDRRIFAMYLCEVYNTVKHTSTTQAMVLERIGKPSVKNIKYMKFCLKHALEEVGHEQMALHDIKSLGANISNETMPGALPKTQEFVDYVYSVVRSGNPLRRLGYSYWAEGCYELFKPISFCAFKNMKLEPRNLTFFIQHGEIDAGHEQDVKEIISLMMETKEDADAIAETLRMTVRLTGEMLEGVHTAYRELLEGKRPEYEFLNEMPLTGDSEKHAAFIAGLNLSELGL